MPQSLTLRPALARLPLQRSGLRIEALLEGTVLHLLAPVGSGPAGLTAELGASGLSLRPVSPGQWFAVGDAVLSNTARAALAARLKPAAEVVDQSHGRVRIALSGPMATRVLAKGTAADLSLTAFPIDHATTTLIGHIAAHLTRIAEDRFELIVLRGFAESQWEDLDRMSAEFG